MLPENLRGLDIAALDTLRIVHQRGTFSAAAAQMNVRQSSVSYTINRLREAFSDPLFVRQGNRMQPTERCSSILLTVESIIGQLEGAAHPETFDPGSTVASITLSVTFFSRSVVLPYLFRQLRKDAPGLHLDLIDGYAEAGRQLISGSADLALSPVQIEESGVYGKPIMTDDYVCLTDPSNSLAADGMSAEDFVSAPKIKIHYGQRWRPQYHQQAESMGHQINFVVSTPNPEDVRYILPGTDLVVAMPSLIARQFAPDFAVLPCPIPAKAEHNMYWPARLHRSPLHIWVRENVEAAAAELNRSANVQVEDQTSANS